MASLFTSTITASVAITIPTTLALPSEYLVIVYPGSRYRIIRLPRKPALIMKAPIPKPFVILSPDIEGFRVLGFRV